MLPETTVEHVRRLLAAGTQSMRKIARTTGISRGVVAAIAHGTRRQRPPRRRESDEEPLGPIERCPECGTLAHTPCRACRVRGWLRITRRRTPRQPAEEPLRLELAGEFRHRYEEVRARRVKEDLGE